MRSAVPKVALQKRDSKSLEAVMRSAALTEKLKNALQDNKSQSMDEGIFNEKDEHKNPANENSAAVGNQVGVERRCSVCGCGRIDGVLLRHCIHNKAYMLMEYVFKI